MDFFGFPAEIRLEIYELLLVVPMSVIIFNKVPFRFFGRPLPHTSLLQVCKHFNDEAAPVLYAKNTFESMHAKFLDGRGGPADEVAVLDSFFERIGERNTSLIRRLLLRIPIYKQLCGNPWNQYALMYSSDAVISLVKQKCHDLQTTSILIDESKFPPWSDKRNLQMVANFMVAIQGLLSAIPGEKEAIVYAYGDGDGNEFLDAVTSNLSEWTASVKWLVGTPIKSTETIDERVEGEDDDFVVIGLDDRDGLDLENEVDVGFADSEDETYVHEPQMPAGSEKLARWRVPPAA